MIGSVKTNIGHLEAAAGIAGLLKVVVALRKGQIPPHLHFKNKSPYIDWDSLPIAVPTSLMPWEPVTGKRIAGLSSFGFSGTNAHLILEEAPALTKPSTETERPIHLLTLSGKSGKALQELVQDVSLRLENEDAESLADICFTANAGRSHFAHRMSVLGENSGQVRKRLSEFLSRQPVARRNDRISFPTRCLFVHRARLPILGYGARIVRDLPVFPTCHGSLRRDSPATSSKAAPFRALSGS